MRRALALFAVLLTCCHEDMVQQPRYDHYEESALFPNGQRRRMEVPIELLVLAIAFFERAFTSYVGGPGILGVASGSVLVIIASSLLLLVRLRAFQPAGIRRVAA